MFILKLFWTLIKTFVSFFLQMMAYVFCFLCGISGIISRIWMLIVFASVCFHACGLDKGTYNMFSDTKSMIAIVVITMLILFAQTILDFLAALCIRISDALMGIIY